MLLAIMLLSLLVPFNGQAEEITYETWEIANNLEYVSASTVQGSVIWCATTNGLASYDTQTGEITETRLPELAGKEITSIAVTNDGSIWIGTYFNGLYQYNNGNLSLNSPGYNYIYSLTKDEDGTLWVGSNRRVIKQENGSWSSMKIDIASSYACVTDIQFHNDEIYAATTNGAFVYRNDAWENIEYLTGKKLSCLFFDDDGTLYAGEQNNVMSHIISDDAQFSSYIDIRTPYLPPFDNIDEIWVSENYISDIAGYKNSIYAGTKGGVYKYTPESSFYEWARTDAINMVIPEYFRYEGANPYPSQSTLHIIDNELWTAYPNGLICRLDDNKWRKVANFNNIASPWVQEIRRGNNGGLWFGTKDLGYYHYLDGTLTLYDRQESISLLPAPENVDLDGGEWKINAGAGVTRSTCDDSVTYTMADGLISDDVNCITTDRSGSVWFGTDAGISRFRDGEWTSYDGEQFVSPVIAMCEDAQGDVWCIAADYQDEAFYRFSGDKWYHANIPIINLIELYGHIDFGIDKNNNIFVTWVKSNGWMEFSNFIRTRPVIPTDVDDEPKPEALPTIIAYPNPFNPSTTISFTLPESGHASLTIYNLAGQKVRTLMDEPMAAGNHTIVWNGRDDAGNAVAAGVYFTRLNARGTVATGKMVLVK